MIREHPQGAGPLVGRQIRYLVNSRHGWLVRSVLRHRRCNWVPGTDGLDGTPGNGARSCMEWSG